MHIGLEIGLGGVLRRGSNDQPVLLRLDPIEDVAQPLACVVLEALGDPVRLGVRNQHHESARQRHLLGQASPLDADRILRDLTHDHLTCLQYVFDACATLGEDVFGVVLNVAAVEHGVLRRRDVDERRFHAGEHVLDPSEIDVAVNLADIVGRPADVMLDQVAALQDGDLGHARTDLHAHEVPADRFPIAFTTAALLDQFDLRRGRLRLSALFPVGGFGSVLLRANLAWLVTGFWTGSRSTTLAPLGAVLRLTGRLTRL